MARVTLGTGDTITVGGVTEIFGTSGAQSVTILDGSTVTFRSGFNTGGDSIRLNGRASDFQVSISGSNVRLTSAVDGITIVIPVGNVANTLVFDNGDTRSLSFVNGVPTLGTQTITGTATALTAGPGVYSVAVTPQPGVTGTEGDTVTFTVTRTDTSIANETLQFTVQGDTANGTLPAAVSGLDFTAANTPITFVGNSATATFTVALNADNNVEGIEGYRVAILKGATTVASTSALILDANNVGQTFSLTTALDRIGTGSQLDLIGSEGSTNTNGQDTIVATVGTINTFDNINGGLQRDLFIVLDSAAPFTFAPNFTNVTVTNVEALEYTSQRGLFNGTIDTRAWTGLVNTEFNLDSNFDQTFTLATTTNSDITQAGNGDVNVIGGGGLLTIEQLGNGDTNVGTTGAANAWTSISVDGGDDVTIVDNLVQELTTVVLSDFDDDATLTGTAITSVTVRDLDGGSVDRDVTLTNAAAVAVTLSNIDVNDLDVILQGSGRLTVNGDGSVDGLDDITAGNNVTVNSTGGTLVFDDISAGGSDRTVTLNATGGNLILDDLTAGDVIAVNITGTGSVALDVVTQSGDATGTVITSTNTGGVTIGSPLASNTRFAGAASNGNDTVAFNGTDRSNSFGGGNDVVTFNANAFVNIANNGDTGSFDGGANRDTFRMESNNANTFSATAQAVSNFEVLELLAQTVAKHDTINLANLGFNATTGSDVISNVGNGSVAEVTSVVFTGPSASSVTGIGDKVVFTGRLDAVTDIVFADKTSATAIATAVRAQILADLPGVFSIVQSGSTLTLTDLVSGEITDLTGSITFTNATSVGTPSLEQGIPVVTLVEGVTPVTAVSEQQTLVLTDVSLLNGQSITISWDPDGAGGLAPRTFTYLNNTGGALTQNGGALADAIVAAANAASQPGLDFDDVWTAERVGNNVRFTAIGAAQFNPFPFLEAVPADGNRPLITLSGLNGGDVFAVQETRTGATGVTGVQEVQTFALDGVASGEDTLTFDGVTITFVDGSTPAQLAAQFNAQYTASGLTKTWEVIAVVGSTVTVRSLAPGNRPQLTTSDFVFGDDTNAGVPSANVNVTTQGTDDSVTLNNFVSGSTLTLNAVNGTHTVNTVTDTGADVLNLVLALVGNHGLVTVNNAETVNINTAGNTAAVDTLNLFGGDLTTLVLTGANGLTLDTNSTIVSSVDASALGGKFTWDAGANTVAITVRTGAGGSDVDFTQMTIPGGNASAGTAPITFLGGSGNDEVTTGDLGTSRGTITTGAGNDVVFVGIVDGGNDFWSIKDFDASNSAGPAGRDVLDFAAASTFLGRDQVLEPTAIFQDYLDQAARGNTIDGNFVAGGVRYFWYDEDGDGDIDATYVVQDNSNSEDFVDGTDTVIRLEGQITLTADNFI
ncbi:hypothetical protein FHS52_002643 [Erythromicrobium ramosum]|uniref:Uncharacterized protein n=1 Tax=Erythrobacter ramosus TaxID=35811 RepID=A0A6I4UKP9_9SPHN|nr:hypothetical protein [Erythrobacter ramosus]MBB3776651.1 hypothetical protein [Erythrobacter ramosus]MXP39510.1 hypothetical protein [Erythrobacter ramosus]